MTKLASMFEIERDLSHSIVHIDMDAFYAAVEMEDDPSLREKPMAVGTSSMLSTSNYLARKFGVRAAMPGFIAKKLCPKLIIVPCNFEKYRKVSKMVRNVIKNYDPDYSSSGLDEFYLDLTEYIKLEHKRQQHKNFCITNSQCSSVSKEEDNGDEETDSYKECLTCSQSMNVQERDQQSYDIVNEIRRKIQEATNLTASAGIAPNTMLAKVCSDQNKPNGQYQIPSTLEAVQSFISTLPVKKVSGIGPVQGQILNALGIFTCVDLWTNRDIVGLLFSPSTIDFYIRVAIGLGSTTVKSDYVRKSIGTEHTFREMSHRDELLEKCQEICEEVVEDMVHRNMLGKVIVLKYKTTNFVSHTRNHSLSFYTSDKDIIMKAAKKLLDAEIASVAPKPLQLRLMGIRIANLIFEGELPSTEKHLVKIKEFLKPCCSTSADTEIDSEITETESLGNSSIFVNNKLNPPVELNSEQQKTHSDDSINNNCPSPPIEKAVDLSPQKATYTCPICNLNQNVKDLTELNTHIDNCLNKVEIRKILAEEQVSDRKRKLQHNDKHCKKPKTSQKTSRRIDEYFH
ncbi:DNA polymerase kappa isoform X2 [Parasteatoda tepidariorum]|nr:DNA polymerase kappa isoform X2 [Parasteatoda tepidariorum]